MIFDVDLVLFSKRNQHKVSNSLRLSSLASSGLIVQSIAESEDAVFGFGSCPSPGKGLPALRD